MVHDAPPGLAVAVNDWTGEPPSLPATHETLTQPSCASAASSLGASGTVAGFGVMEGDGSGVGVGGGGVGVGGAVGVGGGLEDGGVDDDGEGLGGGGGGEPVLRRTTSPSSRLAIASKAKVRRGGTMECSSAGGHGRRRKLHSNRMPTQGRVGGLMPRHGVRQDERRSGIRHAADSDLERCAVGDECRNIEADRGGDFILA